MSGHGLRVTGCPHPTRPSPPFLPSAVSGVRQPGSVPAAPHIWGGNYSALQSTRLALVNPTAFSSTLPAPRQSSSERQMLPQFPHSQQLLFTGYEWGPHERAAFISTDGAEVWSAPMLSILLSRKNIHRECWPIPSLLALCWAWPAVVPVPSLS